MHPLKRIGGDEENRTPDPLLARQVLSQLSYTPTLKRFINSHSFHEWSLKIKQQVKVRL